MTEEIFLAQVAMFSDLSDESIAQLVAGLRQTTYEAGEVIVREDDESARFFLITSGRVRISLRSQDDREVTLSYLGPGDFFGEMSVLDGEPRSATATATERTVASVGTREHFLEKLREHPVIALSLLKIMSLRLREADERIGDLSFLDVQGRVARLLLDLAGKEGEATETGVTVPLAYTRQELANMVSTSRETLTRVLKTFERLGFIRLGRKKVLLTNIPRLERKIT